MTQKSKNDVRRFQRTDSTDVNDVISPETSFSASNQTVLEELTFEEVSGGDLPGYKSVIRNRMNATNGLTQSREQIDVTPGSSYTTVYRWQTDIDGNYYVFRTETSRAVGATLVLPAHGTPVDDGQAANQGIARFVSNARQAISPTAGGVILGEIRETLHMIRHPADAIRSRLSSYLSTVKKNGRGLKKARIARKNAMVAETWLEYAFGWAPLLHDIEDSMKALAQLTTGVIPTIPIRGKGEHKEYVQEYDIIVPFGYGSGRISVLTVDTIKAYYYGAVSQTVSKVPTFRGSFGLRAHDILPTVWELIPYSFLVDYFTNIGDIISAASFSTSDLAWWGESHTWERVTKTHSPYDMTVYPANATMGATGQGSFNPGISTRRTKLMGRTLNPKLVPGLSFKIPGSPRQYFNILALAAQRDSVRSSLQ